MQTRRSLLALCTLLVVVTVAASARAAGTFKFKTTEIQEVSGAWHLFVKIELPKAPPIAHQSMRFVFTKTAVYERALVDGHDGPVLNRQALVNQAPSQESLDVDFADPSGKIFKGTNFDFGLTRSRGYEAGEYDVELRTSDGVTVGGKQHIVLKGDNDVVDRRSITFNANQKSIKKVDAPDAGGANVAKNDDTPAAVPQNGDVTPTGTATGFVPKEGQNETDEEKIKTRPKGCGCSVPGADDRDADLVLGLRALGLPVLAAASLLVLRRRRRAG